MLLVQTFEEVVEAQEKRLVPGRGKCKAVRVNRK
jgi:hypothetical protein